MRAGHEVHLLCQDRDPLALEWVDAAGDWDGGALEVRMRREPARATVYRPDIGGLLPVYVADRYEGVEARPFPELSDEEVEHYVRRNVAAVREVAERVRPDVALANHLVMGPAILARALAGRRAVRGEGPRQRARVHRQAAPALHAVRRAKGSPARAGSSSARATRGRACGRRWATRPAGPDPARARPASTSSASRRATRLRRAPASTRLRRAWRIARRRRTPPPASSFARDDGEAAAALAAVEPGRPARGLRRQADRLQGRRAAAGRVAARARARAGGAAGVVGFGGFRAGSRRSPAGSGRDLERPARRAARTAASCRAGAFLDALEDRERATSPPRADADRSPSPGASTTPSWPTCCRPPRRWPCQHVPRGVRHGRRRGRRLRGAAGRGRHSGLAEVAARWPPPCPARAPWLSFEVGPAPCASSPTTSRAGSPPRRTLRARTREAIVAVTRERYSWDGVARGGRRRARASSTTSRLTADAGRRAGSRRPPPEG